MTILAGILGIFSNSAVLGLAVQLIERYIASLDEKSKLKALMIEVASELRASGVKGLKSRFEEEAGQIQSADDKWKAEAAKAKEVK